MGKEKLSLLLITLVGGLAVIASYFWGFTAYPDASTTLWGGVPASAIPVYTTNMLLAAGDSYFLQPICFLVLTPDRQKFLLTMTIACSFTFM